MLNGQELSRFIELLSKFTKIPQKDLKAFLKDGNDIPILLKRPQSLTTDANIIQKLGDINELRQLLKVGLDVAPRPITSPQSVYNHLIKYADKVDKEYFLALFLDAKNNIIKTEELNIGTHNASLVSVKDLAKKAVMFDSANVIIAHNHPSGDPKPSSEDIIITRKIHSALTIVDVTLLDHIVLGDNCFISMKEQGQMDNMKGIKDILFEKNSLYSTDIGDNIYGVKAHVVGIYANEFPAIKYIKEETAQLIASINNGHEKPRTIKEIKQAYSDTGKHLENDQNNVFFQEFKLLQKIVDDLKNAQLTEKQVEAKNQVKEETQIVKVNVIER